MIVRFNARGSGGSDGPVRYLLGQFGTVDGRMPSRAEQAEGIGLREVTPEVLRGDVDLVSGLIDASPYAQKYASGCLSFAERDLPAEQKRQLMDSFEQALFPGLERDQYTALWVEHRDKGRLELNFLIPGVELTTGKRLQPYYHSVDKHRIDAWQTMTNAEHGFHDPNDPANRQALTKPRNLPRNKQEAAQAITIGLLQMADAGHIQSRADVVETLTGSGFEVVRETKSSISIADPEGGRNIRLKGALYERDFELSPTLSREIEAASREYRTGTAGRLQAARERYQKGARIKHDYHRGRYQRPEPPSPEVCAQDLAKLRDRGSFVAVTRSGPDLVAGRPDNRELAGDQPAAAAIGRVRAERQQDHIGGLRGPDLHPRGEGRRKVDPKWRQADDVHTRGVLNDRARATVTERIRRFGERVAEAAGRIRAGFAGLAAHVRGEQRREQGAESPGQQLGQSLQRLSRASREFGTTNEKIVKNKNRGDIKKEYSGPER